MNVLIVEDETAAYENLVDILMEVAPGYTDCREYRKCHPNRPLASVEPGSGVDIYGYTPVRRFGLQYL